MVGSHENVSQTFPVSNVTLMRGKTVNGQAKRRARKGKAATSMGRGKGAVYPLLPRE